MPSMAEIYKAHSIEYDELVNHEDYKNNIKKTLNSLFSFKQKTICEYGCGTGRLTKLYIEMANKAYCYDREQHMLDRFKQNLINNMHKISVGTLDNLSKPIILEGIDIIIEGWSFGHAIVENKDKIEETISTIVNNCETVLANSGDIIFIETLGSNSTKPRPPSVTLSTFYEILEHKYNFKKEIIETDYKFKNVEEAKRIFTFFFGNEIAKGIEESNSPIIKEYTGIWYKKLS
jgi:SAM-dependent methyltransferase